MDREEVQKDRIAFIFSNLDFEKISDQLVKYGKANTGGELIDLYSNYNSKPIHICYLNSSDDEDFSHYYCDKEDFVDIIERTKKIVSEESPEYLEIFNKSAKVIYNKLKFV